jgi:hypothetical protein
MENSPLSILSSFFLSNMDTLPCCLLEFLQSVYQRFHAAPAIYITKEES